MALPDIAGTYRSSINIRALAVSQLITAAIYLAAVVVLFGWAWAITGHVYLPRSQDDWPATMRLGSPALFLFFFLFPLGVGTLGLVGILALLATPLSRRARWALMACSALALGAYAVSLVVSDAVLWVVVASLGS